MKYSPNWHCVVGKHFASYVTYTSKHYIFFYIGQMAILLYKLWGCKMLLNNSENYKFMIGNHLWLSLLNAFLFFDFIRVESA